MNKIEYTFYHGSDEEFTSFDFKLGGTQQGRIKNAMHFTSSLENAKFYGWNVYEVDAEVENNKTFFVTYQDAVKQLGRRIGTQELIEQIKKEYPALDLIIIADVADPHIESDIYVLFNPECIKSVQQIRK